LRGTWLLGTELREADLQDDNLESATLPQALQQGASLKGRFR
ncbi:MAG: pentapeptide repeat-containing protein, partial [Nitrospinae bacterium]|nr:pentapeptide repeat-containing protein [Nitrospinota bacterium]